MAKYYKEILHLLALGEEHFEEELRKLVSGKFLLKLHKIPNLSRTIPQNFLFPLKGLSTVHLTPFQVVTAINHAQLRLGSDFKQEEFDSGVVGQLMIDEDFNFEKAVSSFLYELEFALF